MFELAFFRVLLTRKVANELKFILGMVSVFACFVTWGDFTRLVLEKVGFSMLLARVIQGCSPTGCPALRGKLFSVRKKKKL